MVFYFLSTGTGPMPPCRRACWLTACMAHAACDPPAYLYMGKDKYENEDLIKFGFDEDIWCDACAGDCVVV